MGGGREEGPVRGQGKKETDEERWMGRLNCDCISL
jgi:hypothetical protein